MMNRRVLTVATGIFFLISIITLSAAQAGVVAQYLGEVRFEFTNTFHSGHSGELEEPEGGVITLGVTHTGGPYYLFQGSAELEGDAPQMVFGNGKLKDGLLTITTKNSQGPGSSDNLNTYDTAIAHIVIDTNKEPWSGHFWANSNDFDPELFEAGAPRTDFMQHDHYKGTIELVGEPISLVPPDCPCGGDGGGEGVEVPACYKKENGQLRIVTDTNQCLPSELPIFLKVRPVTP
jgi:hypothetical protein